MGPLVKVPTVDYSGFVASGDSLVTRDGLIFKQCFNLNIAVMNKTYLQSQFKSTGLAYVITLFLFGSHFAYLGKWGLQFLFWFTFYGVGVWFVIEMFLIPSRVEKHNALIAAQIDDIERKERQQNIETLQALRSQ